MGEVFKKSPAVVINAVGLQDKQLANVPGSDVSRNLDCSARVIFIVNFNYLQQKQWINYHYRGTEHFPPSWTRTGVVLILAFSNPALNARKGIRQINQFDPHTQVTQQLFSFCSEKNIENTRVDKNTTE